MAHGPEKRTTRRAFLAHASSLAGAAILAPVRAAAEPKSQDRKKIAFLGTVVRTHSHAQHFLDRLTLGYGWRGAWQMPRVDVASVYLDQFPDKDLGRGRVARP